MNEHAKTALPPLAPEPELLELASRVIWFEPPEQSLADTARLVAYAMTYGDYRDVNLLGERLGDDGLRGALDHAPPGIFDPRSWAYWNLKLGRYPTPPMPERAIP